MSWSLIYMKALFFILFLLILLPSVITLEIQQLTPEGISEELGKNEEITFFVYESSCIRIGNPKEDCSEKHKFKSVSIDSNSINITIDKTNSIKISLSETRKADIDKDNIFDISITLNSIRSQVGSVILKSLDSKVEKFESTTTSTQITQPQEQPKEEIKAPETNTTNSSTAAQETQKQIQQESQQAQEPIKLEGKIKPLNKTLIIAGILIALILIIVISLVIIFKKKQSEQTKLW